MASVVPYPSKPKPLNNIHILMVSFPGQGHINPLLRLGKRLCSCGMLITFSTPEYMGLTICQANNMTPDEPTPVGSGAIRFEFFDDGWDGNAQSRGQNLADYIAQLECTGREKISLMIRKHKVAGQHVTYVISNPFIPWVTDVAESLGVPSALLWVQSCACFSVYYHNFHKLVPFPSDKDAEIDVQLPCMPLLKHDEVPSFLHPKTPCPCIGEAILGQFKNLDKVSCVLVDTFDEFEHELIEYMSKMCGPIIKPIGPLFKNRTNSREIKVDLFQAEDCMDWLDTKPEQSMVYISFGTVVHLKPEQIEEIAYGLLAAKVSFLWVLRHVLPVGLLEELSERGRVVQWCPQEVVLAHPSIACFVTHCGWNSTLETVASGVPVVVFPQWGDQVTNAKFLVDVYKMGIRMCRGETEERIVGREEVEKCLRASTSGPGVVEMKRNALRWKNLAAKAVMEGGSSDRNMREFIDVLSNEASKLEVQIKEPL